MPILFLPLSQLFMKKEYNLGKAKVKLEVRKNTKKEFLQSVFGIFIVGILIYYFFFNK